jgi:hypothetical protein
MVEQIKGTKRLPRSKVISIRSRLRFLHLRRVRLMEGKAKLSVDRQREVVGQHRKRMIAKLACKN